MELNTGLVEAFGKLEGLCNQIYGEKHGVTCYINDMENASSAKSRYIDAWDEKLGRLKEIRHKRNRLSHNDVSFSTPLALKEDIAFVERMYKAIMDQSDPLSLYRTYKPTQTAPKKAAPKKTAELPAKGTKSAPKPTVRPKTAPKAHDTEPDADDIINGALKVFVALGIVLLAFILLFGN